MSSSLIFSDSTGVYILPTKNASFRLFSSCTRTFLVVAHKNVSYFLPSFLYFIKVCMYHRKIDLTWRRLSNEAEAAPFISWKK